MNSFKDTAYQVLKKQANRCLLLGEKLFSTLDKRVLNGKIEVLKMVKSYESAAN